MAGIEFTGGRRGADSVVHSLVTIRTKRWTLDTHDGVPTLRCRDYVLTLTDEWVGRWRAAQTVGDIQTVLLDSVAGNRKAKDSLFEALRSGNLSSQRNLEEIREAIAQ